VSQLPSSEKRWALIIGVDTYEKDISSLRGAVNDAQALKDVLVKYAGFLESHVVLLRTGATDSDQLPRRSNILDELNKLSYRVPHDGLLLFSFSGHGVSIGTEAYLIPSDGRITKNLSFLRDFGIDVQRIKEGIKEIKVKQVLMFLDACRNQPGRGETPNPMTEAYTRGFSFDITNNEVQAFATLYATSIGERAFEFFDKQTRQYRGYFSYAIEEGMKGKAGNARGQITLGGLISYVENTVPSRVRFETGEKQVPFNEVAGYKENDLILALEPAKKESTLSPGTLDSSSANPSTNSYVTTNYPFQEALVNYRPTKIQSFKIGQGKYEFKTAWSRCSDDCIYSYSDYIAGIAHSGKTDFETINDLTAYDMSSRARTAKRNDILVLKNKAGYYALVQVTKISDVDNLLTIRYQIIPQKLNPTWKASAEKYASLSRSGRVTFDFANNNGRFTIGEKDFKFITLWDEVRFQTVRLYRDHIKALALVPDLFEVRNSRDAQALTKSGRTVNLSSGKRAILWNSKGSCALIKVISVRTDRTSSSLGNELVFEYQIFPN
jgi:hypothetical protein